MKTKATLSKSVKKIFAAKEARRRDLAKLSFPKKMEILIQLQKMASEMRKLAGRSGPQPWGLSSPLTHQDT